MPWCPKCKAEYREDFTICADCKVELVDELPQEKSESEAKDNNSYNFDELINTVLLVSVSDDIQCKLIENMLLECDIPCYIKYEGCGTYLKVYMGNTVFGINIYVDESNLDKAKEIVDVYLSEKDNAEFIPLKEKDNRSFFVQKNIMRIIIALIIIPFILSLLAGASIFLTGIVKDLF
jgi:hypothetical protein